MTTTEPQQKAVGELHYDTKILIDRLKAVKPDKVISYLELSEAITKDVQGKARHLLQSARKWLMNHEAILFDAVVGEGLKRIHGDAIISVADRGVKQIGRSARRVVRKLACVGDEYHKLPIEKRHRHNGLLAIAAVVSHATHENQIKAVSDAAEKQISMNKTLEMFTKKPDAPKPVPEPIENGEQELPDLAPGEAEHLSDKERAYRLFKKDIEKEKKK